jgi:REP element-mobilizing transposase RayT
MEFYKRHLPHWQPEGAEFFITFRLTGSLPKEVIARIKNERNILLKEAKYKIDSSGILPGQQRESDKMSDLRVTIQQKIFKKYDLLLDNAKSGPTWLQKKSVATVVQEALHFYDNKAYDLYAYCVMPNHVHVVFKHLGVNEEMNELNDVYPITKILHSIKSYTALECNKILARTSAFWQSESYDRVIRDQDELENTIRYTLTNPVKTGLISDWEQWSHTYCKPELIETFKLM